MIYADPPWSYKDKAKNRGGAERHYRTIPRMQTIGEHIEAHVDPLGTALACWHTGPLDSDIHRLWEAMGWVYRGWLFTWIKMTKHGRLHWGQGRVGTRANPELCKLWTKGRHPPKRVTGGVHSVIHAPVGKHSEKPAEARHRLERLFGDIDRVELYARGEVPGWRVWGDEAGARLRLVGS